MGTVTPVVALVVFLIILCISAAISWRMNDYKHYDKSNFHTFIAILAGLGVFVTFMFYYSVVELQQQQQRMMIIQETSRVSDKVITDLLEEIARSVAYIPDFAMSLTPLSNCVDVEPTVNHTPETCSRKMLLSYKIFSVWQGLIISEGFIDYEPSSFITNFLQRANSKMLHDEWVISKINFNSKTQIFGDLLFEYGLPIEEQTIENYIETANKLIEDDRFKEIWI